MPGEQGMCRKGETQVAKEELESTTAVGVATWMFSATSPRRGTKLVKSNLLEHLDAGFWGLLLGGWLNQGWPSWPGWAERCLFARLCTPSLPPVCVRGGCARTVPALFWRSSAPSLLCYPVCPLWYMCEFPFSDCQKFLFHCVGRRQILTVSIFFPFFFCISFYPPSPFPLAFLPSLLLLSVPPSLPPSPPLPLFLPPSPGSFSPFLLQIMSLE